MNLNMRFQKAFLALVLFFLAFGWLVLFLTITGLFYSETVILSILISSFFALRFDLRSVLRSNLSKLVILIALAVSFATCYFATPTIFGGRDQGAISTAAIYLAKNHQLKFSTPVSEDLFQKYGPGKALNYPGFDYTRDGKLTSRFPAAYTSYLAAAYDLFGLKGIQYANLPFLFLFLVIFWLILREIFSKWISFIGFLLAASFFPFLWFAKYTLTETYMLFLVWAGILFFIYYLRDQGPTFSDSKVGPFYLYLSLAAFSLSALTRIEGIIFFLLAIIYTLFLSSRAKPRDLRELSSGKPLPTHADSSTRSDKSELGRNDKIKTLLIISTLFLLIFYLFLNYPALLDSLKNIVKTFLPGSEKVSGPSANLYSHLLVIFLNYNILVYIVGGLSAIIYFIWNFRKFFLKTEFVPLLLLFPALIYLFFPLITLDDPWMLRRYVFAVFPMLIFYSLYALDKFFYHKTFLYFTLAILIVANGFISGIFLKTSENKDLLPQIKTISHYFEANDLILVDRLATGSGWSLMSEPLASIYGKQAVYFFNVDDLKAINQSRYGHIYLIAPFTNEKTWYSDIVRDMNKDIYKIVAVDNSFLESRPGIFNVAVDTKESIFTGIWKIK